LDIPLAGPTLLKRVLHSFLRPPRRVLIHLDRTWRRGHRVEAPRIGYNSGLCHAWVKVKNPDAVAQQRERGAHTGWTLKRHGCDFA
jgi:hypothetical protein